jgi:hypothetical protein
MIRSLVKASQFNLSGSGSSLDDVLVERISRTTSLLIQERNPERWRSR